METLLHSLNDIRKSNQLCDIKIMSKDREHNAHRVILSAVSKYFLVMFQGNYKESQSGAINMEDIESDTMEEILTYIYTCHIDINENNAVEIFCLSDQLQIASLHQLCSVFLIGQLHSSNSLGMYRLGLTYHNIELKDAAFAHLIKNFSEFLETDDFNDLTVDELITIIKQDELNIDKEENIYNCIMKWADQDPLRRDKRLPDIMQYIRFPIMDIDFLEINLINNSRISDEKWSQMIDDIYHRCCRYHKYNEKDAFFLLPESLPCYSRKFRIPFHVIHVFGGWSKGRSLDVTECYSNRSDEWTLSRKLKDPAGSRCYFGLAQIDQVLYFAGGYDGKSYLNTVRKFEPVSKVWSEVAPMHSKRCFPALINLKGKLYAVAGFDGARRLSTVEKYCPKCNQWTLISSLGTSRSDIAAVSYCDKIYAIGGYSGDSLRSVEVYDATTNTWAYSTPLNTRRSGAGAVVLPDGRIFVMGGFDGARRQKTTEFYDRNTNIWIYGPSMHFCRSNFATCVVEDHVYVIGGYTGHDTIADVERYDIALNCWTKVAKLNCARSAMKAALLTGLPNLKDFIWVGLSENVGDYLNRLFMRDFESEEARSNATSS